MPHQATTLTFELGMLVSNVCKIIIKKGACPGLARSNTSAIRWLASKWLRGRSLAVVGSSAEFYNAPNWSNEASYK